MTGSSTGLHSRGQAVKEEQVHTPQNSGNSRPCPTTHQVDITEVVEPEMIQGVGDER